MTETIRLELTPNELQELIDAFDEWDRSGQGDRDYVEAIQYKLARADYRLARHLEDAWHE